MRTIVILGAGFGGLQAALRLGRALKKLKLTEQYGITLVDKKPYYTLTPLLYKIAATSGRAAENDKLQSIVTVNLRELAAGLPITVIEDSVTSINLATRTVRLTKSELAFEYLVIALGTEVNYFGIQGFGEYALPLKTFADALKIRDVLVNAVTHADEGLVRVVVGGGGTTGVELAAEIAIQTSQGHIRSHSCNLLHHTREGAIVNCSTLSETRTDASATFHRVHVTIIEAGPSILAAMDPRVIRRAERRLKRLGVSILTRELITEVFPAFALLASGEKVYFDICIWTGGVKPHTLAEPLSLKKEPRGHLEISSATECLPAEQNSSLTRGVYAIGDTAYLYNPRIKTPIPGMARPAMMEGRTAAMNITEEIKADESRIYADGLAKQETRIYADKNNGADRRSKKYEYIPHRYPYIVPVGGRYAIAKIGLFVISGFPAWIFKGIMELNYFVSVMPWRKALTVWFKGFFIFMRNKRLG